LGRKKTMIIEFGICGAVSCLLLICLPRLVHGIFMFVLRAFIAGAFQVVYVYTPEAYPTEFRTTAVGIGSGLSRIGAMITPFVAIVLAQLSSAGATAALVLYAVSAVVAAVCAFFLPVETMGRNLEDKVDEHLFPQEAGSTDVVSRRDVPLAT